MAARGLDPVSIALGLYGLGNLVNGVWMLADPEHWYYVLPAAVPDFGPLNEHFVRDIGCVFTLLGAGLLAGAWRPRWRLPAALFAAGFSLLHAFVHVADTLAGRVGAEHWAIDVPGVYAPAALSCLLVWWVGRSAPSAPDVP